MSSDALEMLQSGIDAKSEPEIWQEAAQRLKISRDAESDNRQRAKDAKAFRWGTGQWPDDIRRERDGQPTLTINHTNVLCQRQENTLRQQRPRIKVHPVGNGANVDNAKIIQGIIRHVENRSNASIAYDLGAKSAIDIGWGYWMVDSEFLGSKSFDQELKIVPVRDTMSVFMDPDAIYPDGRDQKWCFVSWLMKRSEYRRIYRAIGADQLNASRSTGEMALLENDWDNPETIRIAKYWRIHEVADTLCLMNDGQAVFKSEIPRKQAAMRNAIGWEQQIGSDGKPVERDSARREVQLFVLNGKRVVERISYPFEYIPVVRCQGNVEILDDRVMRKGMVEDLMDPARQYNYWRSASTARYALAPKAPWLLAEGQDDGHPEWDDANRKPYSRLVYKPVVGPDGQVLPPPQRQPPAPVEEGMVAAAAGAEHDLSAVAGMPQENPEIQARIIGGNKYLQRRQGMQDLAHYQYYDNQSMAIAWTGHLLLERIPVYYDTQRMQRIIGEDGKPAMVTINEPQESQGEDGDPMQIISNDVRNGLYSVVMDTGPDYATSRQENAETLMNLLGTPLGEVVVQSGADVILRNMDFDGADDVADRVATKIPEALEKTISTLPKQAQTIIQSLQAQNQQKDQVIQQQQLEIKYKSEIETRKIQGKLEETDRVSERDIRKEAMRGHTQRDVAEIGAAAQLLNTSQESERDERAAQRLIDAGTSEARES